MNQVNKAIITVFTPTYNRGYCLEECFNSLCRQTNKQFEWLIVDDGSIDNTAELVKKWQAKDNGFEIRYLYKENGGMHTAYNVAYENMSTELSINVDSDDYLVDNAIEIILDFWNENKRADVGGIYALDMFKDGSIIGEKFPDDLTEFKGWGYKKIIYRDKNNKKKKVNVHGDKKFIGVNSVINRYPSIPTFENEKYYSLYYKQHYIERDYTILILNKPVCVVEYREDGNSNMMFKQYVKNCKGFADFRKFSIEYAPDWQIRVNATIHYIAESLLSKNKMFISESPRKLMTIALLPMGFLLKKYILRKSRRLL